MKIGVYGNCQTIGMAASIAQLLPEVEVHRYEARQALASDAAGNAAQLDIFAECDVVFIQPKMDQYKGGLRPADLEARCKKIVHFPRMTCRALQPDCEYVKGDDGEYVRGPTGVYQSAIVAGAFVKGLPERRAVALFNLFTYSSLGYTRQEVRKEGMASEAAALGYNFDDFFGGRRGRFMHTINHPAISIIFETAVQGLRKAGMKVDPSRLNRLPDDWLARTVIWPIYPGIAPAYTEKGEPFVFRKGLDAPLSLAEFVSASYRSYETLKGSLTSPLVDKVAAFIDEHVLA